MTSGARPDLGDRPDLTARASSHQADSPAGRGNLRTYLGMAPGVGKTYAMLRDGRVVSFVSFDRGCSRVLTALGGRAGCFVREK